MPLNDARGRRPAQPRRTGARWLRRIAGIGAGVVIALVATAGPALAHADLVSSSPANEARLAAEPPQVVLVYSENVEIGLSDITVVAPDGRRVAEPPLRRVGGQGNTLTAKLLPDQAHGTYVLDWRTVASDDGHVTAGGLTFAVGAPTKVVPGSVAGGGTPGESQATNVALEIMTWLAFAGFALLTGCAAVRLGCLPPGSASGDRAMWPAAAGWLALLGATLAQLLLDGPYTAGLGPAHLFDRSLLGSTVSTHLGHVLMARIGLLALFAVFGDQAMRRAAAARPGGWSLTAVALLAGGLAATWSATSHAASGRLASVALLVTTAHVAAMGLWAGGLFTLGVCLLRPPVATPRASGRPISGPPASGRPADAGSALARAAATRGVVAETMVVPTVQAAQIQGEDAASLQVAVTRFSALALASVITLVITGGYLAVREVASLGALTGTSYGRLVLVKAGGLIIIIAVASRSRRYARHRLGDGVAGLRRTVLIELAGACVLLAVATVLINTAPPRTSTRSPQPPAAAAQAVPGARTAPAAIAHPGATDRLPRSPRPRTRCASGFAPCPARSQPPPPAGGGPTLSATAAVLPRPRDVVTGSQETGPVNRTAGLVRPVQDQRM